MNNKLNNGIQTNNVLEESYLENPCFCSSIPFWKIKYVKIPENTIILRDDVYKTSNIDGEDEPYFRLVHDLNNLEKPFFPEGCYLDDVDLEDITNHINKCYEKEGVTLKDVLDYVCHKTYDDELWICIKDKNTNEVIASAIGEFDREIKEGMIEWVQVSPNYRKKGFGKYLVLELLNRMKNKVKFVTVSGRVNNPSNPLKLYESCGFKNRVIWHVVKTSK